MNSFKCSICSKEHKFITLIESPNPEIIGKITSGESNQRLDVVAKNTFLVNREYGLFQSELKIELTDLEDNLELLVWTKIDGKLFYQAANDNKKSGIIKMRGQLVGQIPFYVSDGIQVMIEIDLDKDESAYVVSILTASALKKDYENGIPSNRLVELLTDVNHGNSERMKTSA